MATATQMAPVETPQVESADTGAYRCECGHELNVFGGGRHRVYFETTDVALKDPIMNRVCPACDRGLPGKNPK
jgi:hypothetical protein